MGYMVHDTYLYGAEFMATLIVPDVQAPRILIGIVTLRSCGGGCAYRKRCGLSLILPLFKISFYLVDPVEDIR